MSGRRFGLLLLAAILLWGGEYLRRDLWEPDEARYAYVAKEMRQDGHLLVPHRHGEFYSHKPPLMFWLINGFSTVTGGRINSVSTRLPSLLGGLLILLGLHHLARRWADDATADRAVLVLATSYLFWHQVGMGQIDALLGGLEMMALVCLVESGRNRSAAWPLAAFCCMGLAILAKGPVGLIIPAGAYIAMSLAAGEAGGLKRGYWVWGPVVALAFPALWLGLAWLQGQPQEYFQEILFKQNVSRAAGELGHSKPIYYFAQYLPLDFLPWALFVPGALVALGREDGRRPLRRRLLGWAGFVVVFFSLVASKRNLYIFLAYPALALLVAAAWPGMANLARGWRVAPVRLVAGLLSAGGAGLLVVALTPLWPVAAWPALVLGAAMVPAGVWVWRGREWDATLVRIAGSFFVVFAIAGSCLLPAFNPLKTPTALIEPVARYAPPDAPLLLYRMNGEILALYAERRGERIDEPKALLARIDELGQGVVAMSADRWDEIRDRLPKGPQGAFTMGSKNLVWLAFGAQE